MRNQERIDEIRTQYNDIIHNSHRGNPTWENPWGGLNREQRVQLVKFRELWSPRAPSKRGGRSLYYDRLEEVADEVLMADSGRTNAINSGNGEFHHQHELEIHKGFFRLYNNLLPSLGVNAVVSATAAAASRIARFAIRSAARDALGIPSASSLFGSSSSRARHRANGFTPG